MLSLKAYQQLANEKALTVCFEWTECDTEHYVLRVTDTLTREQFTRQLPKTPCIHTEQFPVGHQYVAYVSAAKGGKMDTSNLVKFGDISTLVVPNIPQLKILNLGAKYVHIQILSTDPLPDSSSIALCLTRLSNPPMQYPYEFNSTTQLLQFQLTRGSLYSLTGNIKNPRDPNEIIPLGTLKFHAVMNMTEMLDLFRRAVDFIKARGNESMLCHYMYRNKTVAYFQNIFNRRSGIMEVYVKSSNGDPGSPINGKLNGLFFSVNPDRRTGLPPQFSLFGPLRVHIPPSHLFTANTNLYFADFYCNNKAHKVTLVLTQQGSVADQFCRKMLLSLIPYSNPFWWKQNEYIGDQMRESIYTTTSVWVEVFYTENIDLRPYHRAFSRVPSNGEVRSSGVTKNPNCKICNL